MYQPFQTSPVADLTERYVAMQKAQSFVRFATAMMLAKGDRMHAAKVFADRWPQSKHLDLIQRAAVNPGTTMDGSWANPLADLKPLATEFIEMIRPRTVLGRLQGMRRVPFDIRFPVQTAGTSVGWVGEGRPMPASAMGFEQDSFTHSKIAGLVVVTDELARSTDPVAENLVQRDLTNAVIAFSDGQFLDPAVAAVADVSPASITYGADEIESTGNTAAEIEADLKATVAVLVAAGIEMASPYWVMKPTTALHLASLRVVGGERAFPNVTVVGGDIWGIPVLTTVAAGDRIVLLDAAEVLFADDGIDLDSSGQANVEMVTNPGTPTASTVLVSMWQMNLVGLMVRRYVRWRRRREGAVAYISGVTF